ncbi:MAG TPA: RagB/SusD family nutrient uptake outer membrane protein [Prolixibacteraceae bacterium]|nr:RagB/SusD family nutrient uptake outer membrane protein [Prolixibacteraceae bacterium]
MKRIISYMFTIGALFALAGCGDSIVDLAPKDKFTTDVALSSLSGLEGSIYGVYQRGRDILQSNDICMYRQCQTDLVKAGTNLSDQATFRAIAMFDYQFNGSLKGVSDLWDTYYVGINRANLVIEGVDNLQMEDTEANRARRDRVLGEAYFFRAYYNHCLVTKWDNIVLVETASVDPNEKVKLVGADVVYPVIISDLKKAIDLLPEASAINSSGRVSKGVARFLLAKAYLDRSMWPEAAEMAKAVVDDPQYKLAPVDEIFSCAHQDNKDIVFAWQFTKNDLNTVQRVSQQWYPLYDRVDGVLRSFEQGGRPWSRIVPSDYYWTLFDPADKRLNAYHKRFWFFDSTDATDKIPDGYQVGDTVTSVNIGSAGGFGMNAVIPTTNKFFEDGSLGRNIGDAQGYRNISEFRVSEAYLMAAEAYWRAGQTEKGLPYINAIRQRAGVADFTTIDQNIILDESARELGHEASRWEMLKRMGVLVERVRAHNPDGGANIQDYHVRWPIPRSFVDMTKVDQNEGYTE